VNALSFSGRFSRTIATGSSISVMTFDISAPKRGWYTLPANVHPDERPLLTSLSVSRGRPFMRKARSLQVRRRDSQRTAPDLRSGSLADGASRSNGSLAPTHHTSYPVPVRRLAALLHACFRPHLTMTPLRFASARRGLLAQRTSTSKSRVLLGAP
jgi:hypothetical protein